MNSNIATALLAIFPVALCAGGIARGATVEYRMLIDGVFADVHRLTPRTIKPSGEWTRNVLTIEARIVDNSLGEGVHGGMLLSAVYLHSQPGVIRFPDCGCAFGPDDYWDSKFNSAFDASFQGRINAGGSSLYAHTAAMSPSKFRSQASSVAANQWSMITEGDIYYLGGETTLELLGAVNEHLVASADPSTNFAKYPDAVIGASLQILPVPEPASLALAAVACLALLKVSRSHGAACGQ